MPRSPARWRRRTSGAPTVRRTIVWTASKRGESAAAWKYTCRPSVDRVTRPASTSRTNSRAVVLAEASRARATARRCRRRSGRSNRRASIRCRVRDRPSRTWTWALFSIMRTCVPPPENGIKPAVSCCASHSSGGLKVERQGTGQTRTFWERCGQAERQVNAVAEHESLRSSSVGRAQP